MKNLWILTEERPKKNVIQEITKKFAFDYSFEIKVTKIKITPIIENKKFLFTYLVAGIEINNVQNIFIKTVSGHSSFVDFLIFYQEKIPAQSDIPIYAIEETKTDDAESRNTGVYQRCSKFVFIDYFYPSVKKIMLYNLQIEQKESPTSTNFFGTKMLRTIGVEIIGKKLSPEILEPYGSLQELIDLKNSMRRPPAGNVPIIINKQSDKIEVSGRLYKSGGLAHDPNIGALSIICKCLRILGWNKDIIITSHGLSQNHINGSNKFIKIANQLNIKLDGLNLPNVSISNDYWKYETKTEKLGTIFIHLVIEAYTKGRAIFENHAGSEKGYFIGPNWQHYALEKYANKEKYKAGDKTQIIYIPDLIIFDPERKEIINIEGKTYENKEKGIAELNNYGDIESMYIGRFYPESKIIRTVVLYGSNNKNISENQIGFLLTESGDMILGPNAPDIIVEAIEKIKK